MSRERVTYSAGVPSIWMGALRGADYVIMRSVRESLGSIPTEWIDHIVVFSSPFSSR